MPHGRYVDRDTPAILICTELVLSSKSRNPQSDGNAEGRWLAEAASPDIEQGIPDSWEVHS